jgi:ribosomal-protein-alanine N-acetyltransferase
MTQADVDAVLDIELAVQHYPWTRGNFMDALTSGYVCRVDEENGEIRGYAMLMTLIDEAELLNIGVASSHQRKGLGRAQLLEMLDLACEMNMVRVFLEVRASNVAALALYRASGFVEVGLRKGYYQHVGGGEDAITMVCELVGEVSDDFPNL